MSHRPVSRDDLAPARSGTRHDRAAPRSTSDSLAPARRRRVAASFVFVGGIAASVDCLPSEYFVPNSGAGATEGVPPCENGILDPGESDVDCGLACAPCPVDHACKFDEECETGLCYAGTCHVDLCAQGLACPPALDPCRVSLCDPIDGCLDAPAEPGSPCDEPMIGAGVCKGGICVPACDADCSAVSTECRTGVCLPDSGTCAVQWSHEGEKCVGPCMNPGVCSRGICVAPDAITFFESDFADPAAWSPDGLWELGPAKPSMCGTKFEDPPDDHSPTEDQQLAGLVIGGCLPPDFPPSCLVSPPIEVPEPSQGLSLRWWEVSDLPPPYVIATVELDVGMGWKIIAFGDGGGAPFEWTERTVPLDGLALPTVRVRFCVQPMGMIFEPVAGWSLDDVAVIADAC